MLFIGQKRANLILMTHRFCGRADFISRQRAPGRDSMPARKAFPTAGRRGMLGDKNGMVPEGRLAAVILRLGRPQAAFDKVGGRGKDDGHSTHAQIVPLARSQPKMASDPGAPQRGE